MESYQGYLVGVFINGSDDTMSPASFSFMLADSIYASFPTLRLSFSDPTGLFLEMGSFTAGVPLNVKFGVDEIDGLLNVDFVSARRDAVRMIEGSSALGAVIDLRGLHKSYLQNRDAPNIALKGMTAADAVKRLFPDETINLDSTDGTIETYAFSEPYSVVRNVLLPQATDGSHRPFVFWRGLNGALNFKSIATLENQLPAAKLFFGGAEEDDIYGTLLSFLPFSEGLNDTLQSFSVEWRALGGDLMAASDAGTVADGASGVVPFVSKSAMFNMQNLTRQFNPDVGYKDLTEALKSDAMRAGYFIDKALCSLPLHPLLIAGKTVQIEVSMEGSSGGAVNVRGIAFGKGGEIKSDVIIGGFQDAINGGILSLVDTSVTQAMDAMQSAEPSAKNDKEEEVKRVPRKYTRREKKAAQEAPEAKTETSGNASNTVAAIANADAAAPNAGTDGTGEAVQ